ncbi:MAG: hypothetical protein M1827_006905 [Pycnora praestabilis]|nr:MAG: hypothetical protein M1827_006905 [Pycnora praestabilis]
MVGNTKVPPELAPGWVDQPNGRGTIDIMWSCIVTIFLCSWSVLCMNIPAAGQSRWHILMNKLLWMLFAIFFPEVVTALAAEQWASASQSVEDFWLLGYKRWTMRHAFWADMGGFMLATPDFPPIPIDAHQLHHLLAGKHISFPEIGEKDIWDKNKADGFARALTVVQTVWFGLQCLGRAIQHLPLSTFELSTLAFVWCTLPTFFFWNHKPVDAEAPIFLTVDTRMEDILLSAGDRANKPYNLTPLDFINPPPKFTGLALFWLGIKIGLDIDRTPKIRPIRTFANSTRTAPRGLSWKEIILGAGIGLGYVCIHLAGWNFSFPTFVEHTFWRVATSLMSGLVVFYLFLLFAGTALAGVISRRLFHTDTSTVADMAGLFPGWIKFPVCLVLCGAYGSARLYIFVESFVSLRALPLGAYDSVNWSDYIPHI